MIWDWDLWPWRIVAAADDSGLALATYRLERSIRRAMAQIGAALYPSLRRLVRGLR